MKAELKPEELRVGNWLFSLTKNMPFQIWASTIVQVEKGEANALEPIELSEEWLKKAWFVETNQKESMALWDYVDVKTGWFGLIEKDGYFKFATPSTALGKQFKYVHNLQNIYYALTGNELIFNHG